MNIERDIMVPKVDLESMFESAAGVQLFREICEEERSNRNFQQTDTYIHAVQYYYGLFYVL